MAERERPIEVAVIGGGCAGMAAAFELTRPEHGGRYHVTVYQQGWRLGGKGASGRGPADRIEEHGLHLWLGYYENAFRLMRECYAELDRDPESCPVATWRDAFFPDAHVALADQRSDGSWINWAAFFPPSAGEPGDPLDQQNPYSVQGYLTRTAELVVELLRSIQVRQGAARERDPDPAESASAPTLESLVDSVFRVVGLGQLATLTAVREAAGLLAAIVHQLPLFPKNLALRLLDAVASNTHRLLGDLLSRDDELRRLWAVLDMLLACIRGSIRFGLTTDPRGFDAIDDYELLDWLRLNGASEMALESNFVRGLYDLGFAYENGDTSRPAMAAGVGLRGTVRMFFTYRGALFWKMRAGMGDVVFAPFYEVLRRRGVTFRYFHRLERMRLADPGSVGPGERRHVEALELDVQAEIAGGGEYEPLVDVRGLPCWPARPDYGQLVDGERLESEGVAFESFWDRRRVGTRTLRVGEDFDLVVLAVGGAAVPHVAGELIEANEKWRRMAEHMTTTATQAFQLWMSAEMKELGWDRPPVNLSGFVEPFDTWADMRQLIPEESWEGSVKSISYFCSSLRTEGARRPGRRAPIPPRCGSGSAATPSAS
ncbi:MAG: FAD-dependent oxidoreductase [Thermoanaerobaculia bacterium]|nr:FAD-dependent oxidoreductase [Thermoanaerobaculia bacterium]